MTIPSARVSRPAAARWWRPVLLVGGVAAAVLELHGHLPSAAATWAALSSARPGWLAVAVALQVISMGAFAEQQRHLLAAFGVRMPAPVSLAVSYARSAMSTALPAGSAVSAGYAFRQFRARGASQPIAAAVMLLSGAASVAGLALLYAGDLLSWAGPWKQAFTVVAIVAVGVAVGVRRVRGNRQAGAAAQDRGSDDGLVRPPVRGGVWAAAGEWLNRLMRTLRETVALAATVPARRWLRVVALAALNWLTDLACLLAALHAVGLAVPARTVATAYLVTQLVRQIPATPGGIGVIEASLILALTTAGAAAVPAVAAVVIYRVLSCWALIPVGLVCWTTLKYPAEAPSESPAEEPVALAHAV